MASFDDIIKRNQAILGLKRIYRVFCSHYSLCLCAQLPVGRCNMHAMRQVRVLSGHLAYKALFHKGTKARNHSIVHVRLDGHEWK